MSEGAARVTVARPRRRWLPWLLVAIILAILLHALWSDLTRVRGAQQVSVKPAEQACGTSGKLRYCVNRDVRGSNGDIVYHLHGRNLDEQVWNDPTYYTALIQSMWQEEAGLPPTVVTLSYGGTWLLAPRGKKADSGLLDDLMAQLPQLEQQIGVPRRRTLLGESMGGLNVLVAGLTYPKRFAKVAALCPGVYAVSPFAPLGEIRRSMVRTGADPRIVLGVWMLARRYAADEAEWRRIDALHLIDRVGPGGPALYLSNGLYDGYGNFEGTHSLARKAARRGLKVEWHPLYGGHCASDARSLARFLRD